jgi:phosphohistidine phosphatase
MRLYIGRHGEAGHAETDASRALTSRGRAQTEFVYSESAIGAEPPLRVVSSPLKRARQTCEIACRQLGLSDDVVEVAAELTPDSSVASLAELLSAIDGESVLIVGHQPLLGDFIAWLCDEPDLRYRPGTSSLFALEVLLFSRGGASLSWQCHGSE